MLRHGQKEDQRYTDIVNVNYRTRIRQRTGINAENRFRNN